MKIIRLKIIYLQGKKKISLSIRFDNRLVESVKRIKGGVWDPQKKCWYIPFNKSSIKELKERFSDMWEFVADNKYSNSQLLQCFGDVLILKGYSISTIKSYKSYLKRFYNYLGGIDLRKISNNQIRQYIIYLVKEKRYSASSQDMAINTIKIFYREILHREIDSYYLPRPKKSNKLPKILSEEEVSRILRSIDNLKHKCMIYLIYSAGLTPSEVTYIRIGDIDSKKMRIFISSPNGKKDRYVVLSDKLLEILRKYYVDYKPRNWLFEGSRGARYSKRSIQKIFKNAVIKSGINKDATLTILKNSFIVHLLEKGVDIRYISKMLGYASVKTVMKYLKVSKRDINKIKSPLDYLDI